MMRRAIGLGISTVRTVHRKEKNEHNNDLTLSNHIMTSRAEVGASGHDASGQATGREDTKQMSRSKNIACKQGRGVTKDNP